MSLKKYFGMSLLYCEFKNFLSAKEQRGFESSEILLP